ncbi:MAG TPA: zinc-binding dehydrogenase [Candidatus Udaeobacter sp.]|nr:zinc-binding dehydrogenase [Candidatus Udaeobacter sp.]
MIATESASDTMRALRITAPRRAEIEEVPLPEPGASQVRVRLEGCGVCGSNLAVWQGRSWFDYPFQPGAPGHEGWGKVDKVGPGVDSVRIGDRVALLSYNAYAEYDVADVNAIVPVPPASAIFPGEALGCAINIFRRSDIQRGQTVAIIGIGFLGALLVQIAVRTGARVIAISRRQFALDIARRCGAIETLALEDGKTVTGSVMELTRNDGCERVIEAAGEQPALDLASELVGVRGRLIIAGYHQDSARRVNMQLWNWRGIDVVNAHERDPQTYLEGMWAAAAEVKHGALNPTPLYTHSFALEESADAFSALERRADGFLKAWIRIIGPIESRV